MNKDKYNVNEISKLPKKNVINKQVYLVLLIIVCVLFISGCSNQKSNTIKNEKQEISREDKIWLDASINAIYNQRITIKDSVMIHAKWEDSDFQDDIDVLETMKETNAFADEFLDLLNNTNIVDIISSGNELEQYLLFSYLNIQINHYEGLGIYYNWVSDKYRNLNGYKLVKVYSKQFQGNKLIEKEKENFKNPWFAFCFKDDNNKEVWVRTFGSFSKSDITYSTFSMYYYDSFDDLLLGESELSKEYEFSEVNSEIVSKVITDNSEFLDFYIKYKNEFYYPKFDEEHEIKGQWSNKETNKKDPKIGMTKSEVLNSSWGNPKSKNITETTYGTHEQWVYSIGYIYFDDGVVTAIQKSEK